MQPVIKHLPLRELPVNDMTPDEVAGWLDERERERQLTRITVLVNLAYVVVVAALIGVIIGFFTH
jgi:hypothetical protein